jgi:hypothetical protein
MNPTYKTCNKCKIKKIFDDFNKNQNKCKLCTKKYYENNKKKIKEYSKEYYKNNKKKRKKYNKKNKEHIENYQKKWRENNKEYYKEYYKNNKEKVKKIIKKYHKKYYENNKKKIKEYSKEYYKNNNKKINEKKRNKYKNNLQFKIITDLRNRLNQLLKTKNITKNNSFIKTIGLSKKLFTKWIEFNLKIDKLDKYHLDHLYPLSKYNLKTFEDVINSKCSHWTNIIPLSPTNNILKSNKEPTKKEFFKQDLRICIFKIQNKIY